MAAKGIHMSAPVLLPAPDAHLMLVATCRDRQLARKRKRTLYYFPLLCCLFGQRDTHCPLPVLIFFYFLFTYFPWNNSEALCLGLFFFLFSQPFAYIHFACKKQCECLSTWEAHAHFFLLFLLFDLRTCVNKSSVAD